MQLPKSELRPGLAYACDWLQDAFSDYPEVSRVLGELRSHAPYPYPHREREKFEKALMSNPDYCRDHQPGEHLFEMDRGAYVNPGVEAMWMGWRMKTEGVEDAYPTSGDLEPLEPILGWSFIDYHGQSKWALDHPVASGRQPDAMDIKESALSDYVGIGGSATLVANLRETLSKTSTGVMFWGVLLYNAMSVKERNLSNPEYLKYRDVVQLLYLICEKELPDDWDTREADPGCA